MSVTSALPALIATLLAFDACPADPAGQDRADRGEAYQIAGQVVDAQGRPASGATIWLRVFHADAGDSPSQTVDEAGRFSFRGEFPEAAQDVFWSLLARADDGSMGWKSSRGAEDAAMRIELRETIEQAGRIVGPDGAPVARARVRLQTVCGEQAARGVRDCAYPPKGVEAFETATDEEGGFKLAHVPSGGSVTVHIQAGSLGDHTAVWDVGGEELTLTLPAVGNVRGRVVFEGGSPPATFDGLRTMLHSQGGGGDRSSDSDYRIFTSRPVIEIQADGSFECAAGPGEYFFRAEIGPECPWYAEAVDTVTVRAGETVEATMTLRPAARVRGRVVDARGEGLADVKVLVGEIDARNTIVHQRQVFTDAEGRYACSARPGRVNLYVARCGESHRPPSWRELPRIEADGETEAPTIELLEAVTVTGVVVNEAGEPMPGAEVRVMREHQQFFETAVKHGGAMTADEQGRFTLGHLAPDETVPFRAMAGDACTAEVVKVTPGELEGPLKLVVSTDRPFRLHGRVVDERGRPIPGASVSMLWTSRFDSPEGGPLATTSTLSADNTNEDGRFDSGALWPGDDYRVRVKAAGYDSAEAPPVTGESGQTFDVGTVTLKALAGPIAGKVVDSSGEPIAGARVFTSLVRTSSAQVSKPDGGFLIESGEHLGTRIAFATKPGYRLGKALLEPGAEAKLVLLREDEPPPALSRERMPFEEQKRIAAQVLEDLWSRPAIRDHASDSLITYMARIDPARALAWSSELEKPRDEIVIAQTLAAAAEQDVEQAITLAARLSDAAAAKRLRELADEHARSSPQKALRLAEEAVARARAVDEPQRSVELASLGALLVRLDRPDAGRRIIEDAAAAAEHFGTNERQGYYRGRVAQCLAAVDQPAALRLIEPLEPGSRMRYTAGIARTLARTDPRGAVALLETVESDTEGSFAREWRIHRLVYDIAKRDPDLAVELCDRMVEPAYRVVGLGFAALAIAERDAGRAHELLDRAMKAMEDEPDAMLGWSTFGGTPNFAAWVAYVGMQTGHPDVGNLVDRALTLRIGAGMHHLEIGRDLEAALRPISTLALIDPALAARLLEDLRPSWEQTRDTGDYLLGTMAWMAAWAVADPAQARREILAVADGLKEGETFSRSGVIGALDLLTRPPEEHMHDTSPIILNTPFHVPDEDRP